MNKIKQSTEYLELNDKGITVHIKQPNLLDQFD